MIKSFLSLLICLCIMQVSFASSTNIEAHINNNNHSGVQTSGDKDLNGDGNVESQGRITLKPLHLIDLLFVKLTFKPIQIFFVTFRKITYSLILLIQQVDPNLFFRPPIAA